MKNSLKLLWYYAETRYVKLLRIFGVRRSTLLIPKGMYCYTPDIEKNEAIKSCTTYYIKPCKYYKTFWGRYNGCSYLGVITDDPTFDDQCKICGVNDELDKRDLS